MRHLTPREIEDKSMRIIEQEAGEHAFSNDEWLIVRRIIHATADFEVMNTIRFHSHAIESGVKALREGAPIYADTEMLAAAIARKASERYGCTVMCPVADEAVRRESEASGITRSAAAIRMAAPSIKRGIIAIGNAPTALSEAVYLCNTGAMFPALIIGMPVGFVDAAESKEALCNSGLVFITMLGRKGGTPAAVATINALLQLAGGNSYDR